MGLAGESGCGKTTLGNSLIRLDGRMRHVGGSVELDGVELPIGDSEAMDRLPLPRHLVVPQYAMSALNPTRKIGRMAAEVIESRGIRYASVKDRVRAAPGPGRPARAASWTSTRWSSRAA